MVIIPEHKKGESRSEWMARCVPYIEKEGKDHDAAVGQCEGMYDSWKKKESSSKSKKIYMNLGAKLNCHYEDDKISMISPNTVLATDKTYSWTYNSDKKLSIDTSTIIVGDGVYNGVFFPKEELEKIYNFWDKLPININHNDETIEDIVGYIDEPKFDGMRITVKPILVPETSKYNAVMGYIKSRLQAGRVPNVSIGLWADRYEEELEDGTMRSTARNLEPDHLAIVVQGACSPEDGCGIGLSHMSQIPVEFDEIDDDTTNITLKNEDYIDLKVYEDIEKELLKEKIKKEKLK